MLKQTTTIPRTFPFSNARLSEQKYLDAYNCRTSHAYRRRWRIKMQCMLAGRKTGGKPAGGFRRHRTLNRNANVLTKSEILRNAAHRRTSSTCPENLRPVTEFSSWNIHPAYLRPVHITLASSVLSFTPPLSLSFSHFPFAFSLASLIILFSPTPVRSLSFLRSSKFYQAISLTRFPALSTGNFLAHFERKLVSILLREIPDLRAYVAVFFFFFHL